jgi:hypothetical protein
MASLDFPARRRWPGLFALALAACCATSPSPAAAQPGSPQPNSPQTGALHTSSPQPGSPQPGAPPSRELEAAEQAYANLDYAEAGRLAERVLSRRGLAHALLVRATRLRALAHAALGEDAPAREAFVALLAYDPEYRLDSNLSPRIQSAFFEARGFWRGQPARPGVEASTLLAARDEGTVRVVLRDPTHLVVSLRVGYRWGAGGEMSVRPLAPAESVSIRVPPPPPGGRRFDYFVQALNEREAVVFEAGSPEAPKSTVALALAPAPEAATTGRGGRAASSSVFASPLFWALAGVAVVGATTGVYFATRQPGDDRPTSGLLVPTLACGQGACR